MAARSGDRRSLLPRAALAKLVLLAAAGAIPGNSSSAQVPSSPHASARPAVSGAVDPVAYGADVLHLAGGAELAVQRTLYPSWLAVDPDARLAVSTSGTSLTFYDLRAGAMIGSRLLVDKQAARGLSRLSFAGSGRFLLVQTGWGGADLYDTKGDGVLARFDAIGFVPHGTSAIHLLVPTGFATDADVGIARAATGDGDRIAVLHIDRKKTPAAVEVTRLVPLVHACAEKTDGAAVDARGTVGVLRCGQTLQVVDLASGRSRTVALPASVGAAGYSIRPLYVAPGGSEALVLSGKAHAVSGTFVDLATGGAHPLSAIPVRGVLGVLATKKAEALVLVQKGTPPRASLEVRAVDPRGGVGWHMTLPAAAGGLPLAYAERAKVFVGAPVQRSGFVERSLIDGGFVVFDRRGTVAERIGGHLFGIQALLPDGSGHRLYLSCGDSRYLDLADGAVHQAGPREKRVRAPASLLGVDLDPLYTHDCRDRQPVAIEGLTGKDGDSTIKGVIGLRGRSDRWLFVRTSRRVGVVDLEKRRVDRWIDRPDAAAIRFGFVSPSHRDVLLLDASGTIDVFDRGGHLLATTKTAWKATGDGATPLSAMVELPGGVLVAGGDFGLAVAPSVRTPHFTHLGSKGDVTNLRPSPDGKRLLVQLLDQSFFGGGLLQNGSLAGNLFDCQVGPKGPKLSTCRLLRKSGFPARFAVGGTRIIAANRMGGLTMSDASTARPVAYLFVGRPGKQMGLLSGTLPSLAVTPDGRFAGTPAGYTLAYRVEGMHASPLSAGDLRDDRPSAVLSAIGVASADQIAAYRAIEQRRSPGSSAAPASGGAPPSLEIDRPLPLTTDARSLRVGVVVHAGTSPPSRLDVRVNGVPVYGPGGIRLPPGNGPHRRTLTIPLGPGTNRVSFGAVDAAGRAAFGRTFVVTTRAHFPPLRVFYLGVGVSDYGDPEHDLTYAAKDVGDVAHALRELFGDAAHIRVLTDAHATRSNVLAARRFLAQAGMGDLVLVYLAGHGLLDSKGGYVFGTRGIDFAHPDRGGLAYADLESLVGGLRTAGTVVLLDSCHAGGTTGVFKPLPGGAGGVRVKARGAAPIVPAKVGDDLALTRAFSVLRPGIGATVIASAEKDELAYESQSVHNGLFTHALITALLGYGAMNMRGELWLSDLLDGVRSEVVKLTGGAQRPVLRSGNLSFQRPLVAATPIETVAKGPPRMQVQASTLDPTKRYLVLVGNHRLVVERFPSGKTVASTRLRLGAPSRKSCMPLLPPWSMSVTPGARSVEIAGCTGVDRFDVATLSWTHLADGSKDYASSFGLSPDGRYALVCSELSVGVLDTRAAHPAWKHPALGCTGVGWSRRYGAFVVARGDEVVLLDPRSMRVTKLRTLAPARKRVAAWNMDVTASTIGQPSPDGRLVFIGGIPAEAKRGSTSHLLEVDVATGRVSEVEAPGIVEWRILSDSGQVVLRASIGAEASAVRVVDARHGRLSMWPRPRGVSFQVALSLGDRVIAHGDWGTGLGFRILGRNVFQMLRIRDGAPLGSFTGNGTLLTARGRALYATDGGGDLIRITLPEAEAGRGPRHP